MERSYASLRSKIVWINQPGQRVGHQAARDVMKEQDGPKGIAKQVNTPLAAWELFFDKELMEILVKETNREIAEIRTKLPQSILMSDKHTHLKGTDEIELRAVIGLLYYRACLGVALHKVEYLWNDQYGHYVFGATMAAK